RGGDAEEVQNRRSDIDEGNQRRDADPGGDVTRERYQERDVQGFRVEEVAVFDLPVLTETLAMIPDDDDERRVGQLVSFQEREEAADLAIHEGDYRIVACGTAKARPCQFRMGGVGIVGVVQVHPTEE